MTVTYFETAELEGEADTWRQATPNQEDGFYVGPPPVEGGWGALTPAALAASARLVAQGVPMWLADLLAQAAEEAQEGG